MSKRIGFFIFDGLTALDLVGPFDTFAVATELASSRENGRAYDLVTVGLKSKAVVAESGMRFHPDTTILKAPALDTLSYQEGKDCVVRMLLARFPTGYSDEPQTPAGWCRFVQVYMVSLTPAYLMIDK